MITEELLPSAITIVIVDGVELSRSWLESALREWRVESFASAESCLARLTQHNGAPNLFLLDVDLPGMNGFDLCRQIKECKGLERVPVIFVSSRDDFESRLEAFDAGGLDFLVKPLNLIELKQKIGTACHIRCKHQSLTSQRHESETLTSLVLPNVDEYAVLIRFMRALNLCENPQGVVDELQNLVRALQLQCAIQVRLPGLELTSSENGINHPLEIAVINHVRGMGPLFEFRCRAAYNSEHITILVNNVPHQDPELCGRLRNHLAIAAECADARLQAVQTKAENARAKGGMSDVLEALKIAVEAFERKYTLARSHGLVLTLNMINELTTMVTFLGMLDDDARDLLDLVRTKAEDLRVIYDFSSDTQKMLDRLAKQLITTLQSARDQSASLDAPITQSEYPDRVCHPDHTSVEA